MAGGIGCIIKSQTLQAGEPFVLPPGAVILGANDVDSLNSVCNSLTGLETLGCYIAFIGSHDYSSEAFSYKNRVFARGYRLNNIDTLFTTEINNTDGDECVVLTAVGEKLLDANIGVIQYVEKHVGIDGTDQTCVGMLLIKTIPSVANNLELLFRLDAEDTGQNTNTFPRIPFIPLADYANIHKPACPGALV